MRYAILGLLLLCLAGCSQELQPDGDAITTGAPQEKAVVRVRAEGRNCQVIQTNVIATTEEQTLFHLHSDFEGGGTWEDTLVKLEGKYVVIVDRSSVGSTDKNGKEKMNTTEQRYLFPVELVTEDEVILGKGRVVLTKAKNGRPTTE